MGGGLGWVGVNKIKNDRQEHNRNSLFWTDRYPMAAIKEQVVQGIVKYILDVRIETAASTHAAHLNNSNNIK